LWAWAGSAIVLCASIKRGVIKRINFGLASSAKGDVHTRQRWLAVDLLDLEKAPIADIEGPEHALLSEGKLVS
jgi:hypothetical protein